MEKVKKMMVQSLWARRPRQPETSELGLPCGDCDPLLLDVLLDYVEELRLY